jgi:hypothetical protein
MESETIITALSSGGFAAVASLLGSAIIIKSNNIKDRKSKKIIACSIVEDLMCNLGNIKIINSNCVYEYFAIFENIENLEFYMNSIRLINKHRFYLTPDILNEIELMESKLREIAANYYTKRGNDEYSLCDDGIEYHNDFIKFQITLRILLDYRYKKLK